MKKIFLFVFVSTLFFSCKKEKQNNPDENITYSHWYKIRSGTLDTLFSVFIPNAFTPNGNGINDYFSPKGYFTGNNFSLNLFGRDGSEIFHTDNKYFYPGWDGKNGGSYVAQIGVYIYQLKLNDSFGNKYEYKGQVTLNR